MDTVLLFVVYVLMSVEIQRFQPSWLPNPTKVIIINSAWPSFCECSKYKRKLERYRHSTRCGSLSVSVVWQCNPVHGKRDQRRHMGLRGSRITYFPLLTLVNILYTEHLCLPLTLAKNNCRLTSSKTVGL